MITYYMNIRKLKIDYTSKISGHHCKIRVFNISSNTYKMQYYANMKTLPVFNFFFLLSLRFIISFHVYKSVLVFVNENVIIRQQIQMEI
jgi:hypothetical protein